MRNSSWSNSRTGRRSRNRLDEPGARPSAWGLEPCTRDIFENIFMPTTVHVPPALLKSVDRRAKALGISRNRLIVRALEQMASDRSGWAPEFIQRLRTINHDTVEAVDALARQVKRARRSKRPPVL